MLNFNVLIKSEYESAYENAYDLSLKKQFSNPKIYIANGDLTKRWYVYFSYRDPETGKLKRQTPFYGNANTYKTKEERLAVLTVYRKTILKYLKAGYSPYEDNNERLKNSQQPSTPNAAKPVNAEAEPTNQSAPTEQPIPEIKTETSKADVSDLGMTIDEAFKFVHKMKVKLMRESSIRSYKSNIHVFRTWLNDKHPELKYVSQIDKKTVIQFLNHILSETSARNRNNYRSSLSSLFESLLDNELVATNMVKSIKKLKTKATRHQVYSQEMQEKIFSILRKEDPMLLLYVQFISYGFLRPLEVCRLKVGDLNIEKRTVSFKAKNSPLKTKIIPDILFDELPDLSKMDPKALLFTSKGIGKFQDTKLESRRGYFTKRFRNLIKREFDLDLEHTLYSFRHTFITKVYRELRKDYSPFETKSRLMQITGHTSMKALESYLREIDAELPEDYSAMLTFKPN